MTLKEKMVFFRECMFHPIYTSSLLPSSKSVARIMARAGHPELSKVIVELGSGTGSFTSEILNEVPKGGIFFTVEINKTFAEEMKKKFLEVETICEDAVNLPKILKSKNINYCDRIVSGIPWASFDYDAQDALLQAVVSSLSEEGEFVTITFLSGMRLPKGRRFQEKLKSSFEIVTLTPIIWKNFPPAVAYYCKNPKKKFINSKKTKVV